LGVLVREGPERHKEVHRPKRAGELKVKNGLLYEIRKKGGGTDYKKGDEKK